MIQLKQLRENKGLNMREAANHLCLPYTTYVNYEKGMREPTSETLIQIADFFDVSIDQLLGRACAPRPEASSHIEVHPVTSSFSSEEQELIRKYRCLDERGRRNVLAILNNEYESLPGEKARPAPKQA